MWWYFIAKKHPVQVEELSSAEWDSVASKAAACTLIDGDGVLDARGLLPLVSDIIIIDGTQCDEYDEEQSPSLSSLQDGESLMPIDIVPNPASTGWNVLSYDQEILRYTIYSANGAVVGRGSLDLTTKWICAEGLPSGLYFLHVIDDHGNSQIEKLQLIKG